MLGKIVKTVKNSKVEKGSTKKDKRTGQKQQGDRLR